MTQKTRLSLLAVASVAALLALEVPAVSAAPAEQAGFAPNTVSQIEALAAAKASRTPQQRKIESALLTSSQLARGVALPAGVRVKRSVRADKAGRATVVVRGTNSAAVLAQVREAGGVVRSVTGAAVRADVPLRKVEAIAASPAVRQISSVAATPYTSRAEAPGQSSAPVLTANDRKNYVRSQLDAALKAPVAARAGSVASEGDTVHGAKSARRRIGVSGVGVTVGVLSDGVDSLPASIASRNLPQVRVLPGTAGAGDEGTAMLEIVHDVAPKADLMFATASDGPESFAANIRALRAAGADIIVDDILYLGEPSFQDGPIAQAVMDVTRDGALYFSSAGNEGNLDDGTSGNYEADFVSSGQRIGKFSGFAHDFRPGAGVQAVNPITAGSVGAPALLQWADPAGAATNDYDVYAIDAAGDVVGFSNTTQDGDDDPFEGFYLDAESSLRLAVVKFSGADRYFQLTVFRGRFGAVDGLTSYATAGVTRGHSAVPAAFSVAAAPAAGAFPYDLEDGDPAQPSGPFPGQFTADQKSERFTSDGPRRVFFSPTGAPLTPGNLTASGGQIRQKPDLTAADGVRTSPSAFDPFFGTSAAAPHAAAMAALVMSGKPGVTPAQVRTALTSTALDIEKAGYDRNTGAGIVRATAALRAVGASAQAYAVAGTPTVLRSTDGDKYLEPGETGLVSVPVTNRGDGVATRVRVRLSTATAGVTITGARKGYGDLAAGAQGARSFEVSVAKTLRLGTAVAFTNRVTFGGGFSPLSGQGVVRVGQPGTRIVSSTFTGPAKAIPDGEGSVAVNLKVTGVGPVNRVHFSIDGTRCNTTSRRPGLAHPFVSDLVGTLTSPGGTTVQLFNRAGSSGADFCNAVFYGGASRAIQSATAEDAPFSRNWLPAQSLSRFVGKAGNGTWRFRVADEAPVDSGSLRAVSVHVRGYARPPA